MHEYPCFVGKGMTNFCKLVQLVSRYQSLLRGAELVESQLKESLPEYLNAEIALKTVTDVSVAIAWLKGSFFYIRVRLTPALFNTHRSRSIHNQSVFAPVKFVMVLAQLLLQLLPVASEILCCFSE